MNAGSRTRSLALRLGTVAAVGALALSACGSDAKDSSSTSSTAAAASKVSTAEKQAVVDTYADLVSASYEASVASAKELQTKIDTFVATPTEENLTAAKEQWLTARDDYGPTEAFRFYDGPIDDPDTGLEGQINAWPMDEAYVDYVEGNPTAGIVNDVAGTPEITKEAIVAANEEGGETNISTGWHAIEFLLWGQDLSDTGPGARPATDYTTAPNADRRGAYLTALADLLVEDLETVAAQWDADTGEYRKEFVSDPDQAISDMFRGIGALTAGELAGERIAVAYETKDQEDEHSCFSDNTNADVRNNALGVQRVYLAEFPGVTGPSLSSLVAKVNPEVDEALKAQMEKTVAQPDAFPTTFDLLIQGDDDSPGRTALLAELTALEKQGDLIGDAAKALGITVNMEV